MKYDLEFREYIVHYRYDMDSNHFIFFYLYLLQISNVVEKIVFGFDRFLLVGRGRRWIVLFLINFPIVRWSDGMRCCRATGLGFVCFVVINPRVLSANRVDLGFFCFINFPIYPYQYHPSSSHHPLPPD